MSNLDFWCGPQGNDYIDRNLLSQDAIKSRRMMWSRILNHVDPPRNLLEVGANIGQNLAALKGLCLADLFALEPNEKARSQLINSGITLPDYVYDGKIEALPFNNDKFDLVFTSGVLIHINPENLYQACSELYRVSARYIISIEYFSPQCEMIPYRGEDNRLWKRDFGRFWVENFNVEPLACEFEWKMLTGLDNLTWWVFEK